MAQSDGVHNDVYRALPDSDPSEKRNSRHDDSDAVDGAGEKLLKKEEVRIVSADMPDAKYKAGDQVNGEARIEIDSNSRTFTGLTKEELLKYQDDPFWVRLRWTMFVLFWAMWLCMLAGAIVIIVRSPKCAEPVKWFQHPILDMTDVDSFQSIEERLPSIKESGVKGVVVSAELIGDIYDENQNLKPLTDFAEKAKGHTVRVIVQMVANYISLSHPWFGMSERSEGNYTDYLTWAPANPANPAARQPPNGWLSMDSESAWKWSDTRQAYYLHQHSRDTADLNFYNRHVVQRFTQVMQRWIKAGASGIRLHKASTLLVDRELKEEAAGAPSANSHTEYAYYSHHATSNQPGLQKLLEEWRLAAEACGEDVVLTLSGGVVSHEPYFASGRSVVALPPAGAVSATETPERLAEHLGRLLQHWPAVEISGGDDAARELAALSVLLPATPVLKWDQLFVPADNSTWKVYPKTSRLMPERSTTKLDVSAYKITTFADKKLLALTKCSGDKGYLAVYNPRGEDVSGAPTELPCVPDILTPLAVDDSTIQSKDLVFTRFSTTVFTFKPEAEAKGQNM